MGMGTISNARITTALEASGSSSKTLVSGTASLGRGITKTDLSDCDIFYSFTVTSTADTDVASIDLEDSVVSQDTGTPTITDGDGNDFDGTDIPDAVSLAAVYVVAGDENSADVTISLNRLSSTLSAGETTLKKGDSNVLTAGTITFNGAGDTITVTVAAQTT